MIMSADKLSKCFDRRTIQRPNRSCKGASYVLQRMYSFEVVELDWSRLKSAVKVGWYLGYTPPR